MYCKHLAQPHPTDELVCFAPALISWRPLRVTISVTMEIPQQRQSQIPGLGTLLSPQQPIFLLYSYDSSVRWVFPHFIEINSGHDSFATTQLKLHIFPTQKSKKISSHPSILLYHSFHYTTQPRMEKVTFLHWPNQTLAKI